MRHLSLLASSSACAAIVALFSSTAAAHIELVDPSPRYALPGNKACPCGEGDGNRQCDTPAAQSTDPNRSTNVTTFEAGSTITVVADEYIDHAGRMRVAFDPDGADLSDFNDNILMDVADPSESGLSMTNPHVWEFQIQLPDMTCENCTLQVIQVMNNITTAPVMDPAPLSTYYTCADIRLVPAGSLEAGEGGSSGSGGSANAGEAGGPSAGGAAGSGGAAAGSGGAPAGAAGTATSGAGSGSVDDADEGEEEDSGCAFRASENSSAAGWALALLGLAAALRRRQR
jgi:MYXO-CTERM domain-containing protein